MLKEAEDRVAEAIWRDEQARCQQLIFDTDQPGPGPVPTRYAYGLVWHVVPTTEPAQ